MKRGDKHSPETIAKLTGVKHTPEAREKIRLKALGRKPSLETRAKISLANSLRIITAATRKKQSLARIGKKHSPETIAKIKAAKRGVKLVYVTPKVVRGTVGVPAEYLADYQNIMRKGFRRSEALSMLGLTP